MFLYKIIVIIMCKYMSLLLSCLLCASVETNGRTWTMSHQMCCLSDQILHQCWDVFGQNHRRRKVITIGGGGTIIECVHFVYQQRMGTRTDIKSHNVDK